MRHGPVNTSSLPLMSAEPSTQKRRIPDRHDFVPWEFLIDLRRDEDSVSFWVHSVGEPYDPEIEAVLTHS
jgi:hypothetical protein